MVRIVTGPLKRALIVENPHPDLDDLLRRAGFEHVHRLTEVPEEDRLIEILREERIQVLFKRSRMPITRQVIEAADDLVAIQLCCIGDDSVDKAACAERGILVFNDPVSNARSVVELFLGLVITMARRLDETVEGARRGTWEKAARERYEIKGKVLGVVGLGNIGRQVARTAELLGMHILFYDNRIVAQEVGLEMGWTAASDLGELFAKSDIVTVHVSATDIHGHSNEGLIRREHFMALGTERPETSPRFFLNLARGVVHYPDDLKAAIAAGRVRRAAVDVYPDEPRGTTDQWANPYAGEPRVLTTPHIGAATLEAQPRIARRVAHTAELFSRYGTVRDCVFAPRTTIGVGEELPGRTVLLVVHSTARGTKKALDDAIYEANANNLRSQHRDFVRWGIAIDANVLDRPLSEEQLRRIVGRTREITGDSLAVRLVRQLEVPATGD